MKELEGVGKEHWEYTDRKAQETQKSGAVVHQSHFRLQAEICIMAPK